MSTRWKSTDEAISSLHAATAQLQHDAAHRSTTLAQLRHNTASTNATPHSCQIYLHAILLQLAKLQPPFAPPSPFLDTVPSNSLSAPVIPLTLSTFDDSTPPPPPREFPLLKPSSAQTVGLIAPLPDKLLAQSRPPPSFSSPSLLKQHLSFMPQSHPELHHAISILGPSSTLPATTMAPLIDDTPVKPPHGHPKLSLRSLILLFSPTPPKPTSPFGIRLKHPQIHQRCAMALCFTHAAPVDPERRCSVSHFLFVADASPAPAPPPEPPPVFSLEPPHPPSQAPFSPPNPQTIYPSLSCILSIVSAGPAHHSTSPSLLSIFSATARSTVNALPLPYAFSTVAPLKRILF